MSGSACGRVVSAFVAPAHPARCPFVGARRPAGRTKPCGSRVLTTASALRPDETPEMAKERRLRESERVEERLCHIMTKAELDTELQKAGDRLVVVEVQSEVLCQTGFEEEAELQWKDDQKQVLAPCANLKHVFARTARDCPDVVFLSVEADSEEGAAMCEQLGVDVLPTLQFRREGRLLWEHRGVVALDQDLGEGVLYYGDTAGGNVKASTYVSELRSRADFEAFIAQQDPSVLTVVNVALTSATPCVHVFPAVLALAKNFVGYAAFGRLLGDEGAEARALVGELNIIEVPTFIFYRSGKEVGRHVGSSRGDLIGQILAQQSAQGISPPPPPPGANTRRPPARAQAGRERR